MQITAAPSKSIKGDVPASARIQRMFSCSKFFDASRNLRISKPSMPKALTTRFPLMVSCNSWLRSASRDRLSCVEPRIRRASLRTGSTTSGTSTAEPTAILQLISSSTVTKVTSVKDCRKKSAR
jgi:hypothetical protein